MATSGPWPRVLVIDEYVDHRGLTESLLSLWGYDVRSCSMVHETRQAITTFRPEVLVVEWYVRAQGRAVPESVTELRDLARQVAEAVKVVILSTVDRAHHRPYHTDFDAYLTKPVVGSRLMAELARLHIRT